MISISEYYGEGDYEGYLAKVLVEDGVPVVEYWKNKEFVAVRSFPNNNMNYVEDAAENFVTGVLKL